MKNNFAITARLTMLLAIGFAPTFAHAANILMNGSDSSGQSSFNAGTHWTGGAAPTAGNTYDTTTAYLLRTPSGGSTAITFAGDSLTLHGPGTTTAGGGRLDWTGTTGGSTTINNLVVTNLGMLQNGGTGGTTWVLAGGLTIQADAINSFSTNGCVFLTGNGPILVTASISGSGAICRGTPSAGNNGYNVILAGDLSGFTGPIITTDHHVTCPVTVSNANPQTLSGNISLLDLLTKQGPGALILSGSNTFSGGFTLNGAIAGSQVNINSTNALGATASTFTISGGNNGAIDNTSGSALTLLANNPQAWNSDFTFVGSQNLNLGSGTVTLGATRQVTVSANILTVGGIVSGTGFGITKAGNGMLTLNAANTYSGNTTVNGGTLLLGSTGSILNSSNILVASGATFDVSAVSFTLGTTNTLGGSGTVNGNVSDSSGSRFLPGGSGTVGTLTFNNNLTLAGNDTLQFDLASGSNDVINVAGSLTLNGTTTINLASLPAGGLPNGNYTLINATNNLSGTGGFSLTGAPSPSRQTFTIVTTGSSPEQVVLQVTGSAANLVWQPTSSAWDIITTENWLNGASSDYYFDGDSVNFTDAGSSISPVLNTIVTPGSVTFNSANAYTLSGTGKITGGTGLTKTNSGTLTISTPTNDYTGVTYIGGGTVSVANLANGGSASAIGAASSASTSLVLDGGDLQYTGPTASINRGATLNVGGGTVEVTTAASTLTLGGVIAGTSGGGLTKNGNGTLALSGANTYNGSTTVSAGTLQLTNSGSFGSGNVTNNSALLFSGTITIANNIAGTGSLTNDAAGTLTLSGANSYSGAITINGPNNGGLIVGNSSALGNTPVVTVISTTGGANGGTRVTLNSGVSTPAGTALVLPTAGTTVRSALFAAGPSSWNGSITINGDGTASPGDQLAFNGSGGLLTIGGNVTGVNFPGTLQLRGGTGVINGTLSLGANATLQVNDGVTWTINSSGNTWGLSQIASGTLQLGANNALPTGTTVQFGAAGNGTLDLNGFNQTVAALTISGGTDTITNSSPVSDSTLTYNGAGSSTFSGTIVDGTRKVALTVANGTLTLSGADTYSGDTTISGGTLALSGSGSINNSANIAVNGGAILDVSARTDGTLTVGAAQTLTGNGTVNGSVTNDGTITLGASIGVLTVTNNLTLEPDSITSVEVDQALNTSDQIVCPGTVIYGGTLAVANLAGSLVGGEQFTLFSAGTPTGNFSSISGAPSGLIYTFNPASGVLRVVDGNPTNITFNVAGSTLTLSWPVGHQGWILQSQTNSLSVGLTTNWVDVAGSDSSTQAVITVDASNPTVFYRLRSP